MRASTFVASRFACFYAVESVFGVRFYWWDQRVARRIRTARARVPTRSVLELGRRTIPANDPSDAEMGSLIEKFRGLKLA